MSTLEIAGVGELLDEVRHGRPVLLVDDREERGSECEAGARSDP
mgnify:CR=1 FL=1